MAAVPAAGALAAECAAKEKIMNTRTCMVVRIVLVGSDAQSRGSARHSWRRWPGRASAKGDAGVGAACTLRRATASGLAGCDCCEPTDLLRRLRMRAVMSRARSAGGFPVLFQMAAQGPAQVEVGGHPPGLSPGGFQDSAGLLGGQGPLRCPARQQVTDLLAPPQEGCPMRPAGGEGLLAPGVLCLRPGGTGGERQEAQAPRWLASGLVA